MGTRRRTYNVLPVATTEWELHLSRSLGDSTSRGFRDLTDFVCRIVERATIRPQYHRSPPLHRSRSAVGRSAVGRTSSRNRRGRSRTPSRGRVGRRTSPKRMILFGSSPLISPVRRDELRGGSQDQDPRVRALQLRGSPPPRRNSPLRERRFPLKRRNNPLGKRESPLRSSSTLGGLLQGPILPQ